MSTQPTAKSSEQGNSAYNNASLWVGDLHPSVNEALLFDMFKVCGKILSIRVCRDALTRASLGYAYVNFNARSEAEKAFNELQFAQIGDKPIRICWSQRDPTLRNSGVGNIFIKNLDADIDNKDLHDTFGNFGKILSCKVSYSYKNGEPVSNGYGFVHFATQDAADRAIEKMNGLVLNGKKVYVGPFVKKGDRKAKPAQDTFTNIYVKNLPKEWDATRLAKEFGAVGKIQNATIMKDQEGQSRGFGFVNYENHDDAVKAIEKFHDSAVQGESTEEGTEETAKKLFVSRAQAKSERAKELTAKYEKIRQEQEKKRQGTNLYVRNFGEDMDEGQLTKLFEKFGPIESVKIMRDPKKKTSRGFGFVCFVKAEDAQAAMTNLNTTLVEGKPLLVALAQKKEVRRQHMEAQFRMHGRMVPVMRGQPVFYQGPMNGYPMPPGYGGPQMGIPQQGPNPQWPKGGPQGQQPPQGQPQKPLPLDPSFLSQLSIEEQKQQIGNRLYPVIASIDEENAPKITGMIIELPDMKELLNLITDRKALHERVLEAQTVLKTSQA